MRKSSSGTGKSKVGVRKMEIGNECDEPQYRRQMLEKFDQLLSLTSSLLSAVSDGQDVLWRATKSKALVSSRKRHGKRSRTSDAVIRENRSRVVAAIRDLHDRRGLSWMKAIVMLRNNPTWTARMKGVSNATWRIYAHRLRGGHE